MHCSTQKGVVNDGTIVPCNGREDGERRPGRNNCSPQFLHFCATPSTTTRLGFLRLWGSPLVMASQGALAMRAISGIVARLIIVHEFQGLGHAQLGAGQDDRQQHQNLGYGQRRSFFLTAGAAGPKSDAPTTSGSCGDASPATCASHSDPSPVRPWPPPGPSPQATATH